jgi:hypothetical protein
MSYEKVKRYRYHNPETLETAPVTGKNLYEDLRDFHIPLERVHNSNLHDWGIASGLEVSGTIGGTEIIVNPGVAIDSSGQLISLSNTGHGYIGKNPPVGEDFEVKSVGNNEVPVPVHLSIDSHAGKTVYVTIQFSQISRSEGVLGRWELLPWVRLQPVDSDTFDSKSVVLAIAKIDDTEKLAELKAADSALTHRRRLIGKSIEELRIQRSSNVGDQVQDMLSGKIGPGDGGGLKITVPDTQDSILFAKENGDNFANLEIRANVGIGTRAPQSKLHVKDGGIRWGNNSYLNDDQGGSIELGGDNETAGQGTSYIDFHYKGIKEDYNTRIINSNNNELSIIAKTLYVSGNVDVSGNVGIGTPNPQYALDIKSSGIKLGLQNNGGGQLLLFNNPNDNSIYLEAFNSKGDGSASEFVFSGHWANNVPKLSMRADNTIFYGNVGIGTMSPGNLLEIKNNGDVTPAIIIDNGTGRYQLGTGVVKANDGKFCIYDHNTNGHRLVIDENGNIGIGILNPKDRLDVGGTIRFHGKNAFQGHDSFLRINQENEFPSGTHFAHRANFAGGITTGNWWDVDPGWGNLRVQGNVGIGTANPRKSLDVDGDVIITGNLGTHGFPPDPMPGGWAGGIHTWDVEAEGTIWSKSGYYSGPRDLAENYSSDMDLESGDVVCLDEEIDGIVLSKKPNDPLVLGVISTEPGFLLNAKRDSMETKMFPVALCGRVTCKVVGENGPIKRGDLLTSSSTPGHAMKANPIKGEKLFCPGTIIGKAICKLESGKGVIDILVFSS